MKQVRIETFIEAPAAEVWELITDGAQVSRWLMETNIRPEKGFKGYFKMKPQPGFDGKISAEVLEVELHKRFVYSWQGGWMKKPTTISFTLREQPGGTLLVLEHMGFEGFTGSILRMMFGSGWKRLITVKMKALLKQNV